MGRSSSKTLYKSSWSLLQLQMKSRFKRTPK